MARDIVCDKLVNEEEAAESKLVKNHKGQTFYFCSRRCMEEFERDPSRYNQKPGFYAGHSAVPTPPHTPPGRI